MIQQPVVATANKNMQTLGEAFCKGKHQTLARLRFLLSQVEKLTDEQFDYSRYVAKYNHKDECIESGCAVGWLPAFLPAVFTHKLVGTSFTVKMKNKPNADTQRQVERFFGITKDEYGYLFAGRDLTNAGGKTILRGVKDMKNVSKASFIKRLRNILTLIEIEG